MDLKEFYFVDIEKMLDVPFRDIVLRFENQEKQQIFLTLNIPYDSRATKCINQVLSCKTLDKIIEKYGFIKIELGKQWIKRG